MRYAPLLAALMLILWSDTAYADSEFSSLAEKEMSEVENIVVLTELVQEIPQLCCLAPHQLQQLAAQPWANDKLAGLLFWPRLILLCPDLRRTAIC